LSSEPSKPSSSFPPNPPSCSPKLVKKSRREVHLDNFSCFLLNFF
jgi:hypothetical protein